VRSWYHSYRTMADGKPRTVRFAVPQDFGTSDDALPAGVAALPYLTAAPAHRPTSPPFFSRAAGIAALAVMAREQVNSAREVTEYVEKYKLQDILTDAVNEAVTEGTTDPVAYIGRVLLQKAHGSAPKDDTLDFDNLLLCTDSYKTSHWKQYPPGTEYVYSYFESRGGKFDEICFFGLQYFIKRCAAARAARAAPAAPAARCPPRARAPPAATLRRPRADAPRLSRAQLPRGRRGDAREDRGGGADHQRAHGRAALQPGGVGAHPQRARRQAADLDQGGARGLDRADAVLPAHRREHRPQVLLADQLPRDAPRAGVVPDVGGDQLARAEESHPRLLREDGLRRLLRPRLQAARLRLPRRLVARVGGDRRPRPPRQLLRLRHDGGDALRAQVLPRGGRRVQLGHPRRAAPRAVALGPRRRALDDHVVGQGRRKRRVRQHARLVRRATRNSGAQFLWRHSGPHLR
jgi:hypothetical protein